MKIKNIFTYCFISSLFLFSLICIWKILVTLQGIELINFNFNKLFVFGIVLCVINLLIGKKLNLNIKLILLALLFSIFDYFISINLPIWYSFGIFLISLFFFNTIKNYDKNFLSKNHSSQKLFFNFLTKSFCRSFLCYWKKTMKLGICQDYTKQVSLLKWNNQR